MNNKTLWVATIAFILVTFVYIGIQNRKITRLTDTNQLQTVELSTLKDSVSVHANKAGELTYKLSVVEVNHRNLKESLDAAGFEIKQLKDRDINWRKVNNALKLQLESAGHGETALIDSFYVMKTDTIRYNSFTWSNDFLSLNGSVQDKRLFFDYKYKTGIQILQTQNRSATIVSVALTDPNAAIVSANSITVKHERKLWQKPWVWAVVGLGTGILITR